MCTITINPVFSASPSAPGHTIVSLEGTYNCAGTIDVTIGCLGAASQTTQALKVTSTMWIVNVDVPNCPCGSPITITATCNDTPPCTATLNTVMLCNCCPQVNTVANQGLWNSSGQNLVTFVTTLTFPAGCSVTVQRDFGDGNLGTQHTFTSSPATYQETHPYNAPSAPYTSDLKILSNASCGSSAGQITVSSAPPCATHPFLATLCRTLQILFLLSAAVASVLFTVSLSPVCSAVNPALTSIATGLAITAGFSLFVLFLWCRKCVCGFFQKLFGQLFVIVGAVLLMFVLPTFPPALINCAQPIPFVAPFAALGAVVVAILIGASALLGGGWYQQYKTVCPLNICDYWQAIKSALILAVVAVVIVFVALTGGVPFWPHTVVAVWTIIILLALASLEIIINQNAGNC